MRIYKLSLSDVANVYKVCIVRRSATNPSLFEFKSLYKPDVRVPDKWTPIQVGEPMMGSFYVGTKREFCLSYYSGMTDLDNGEMEALITLEVPASSVLTPEEDAYMGSEAVVRNAIVKNIEIIEE